MSRRFDRQGFTLFEMLAAVAVAMVISVFVFSFSTSLLGIMRASDSKIGTEIDAHVALDIIARDLESAVFREGTVMFAVDALVENMAPEEPPVEGGGSEEPSSEDETAGEVPAEDFPPTARIVRSHLRFFTASPAFNAVSYQIIRRVGFDGSERPRYILFRSVVRKDYTETAGRDIVGVPYETGDSDIGHAAEVTVPNLHSFFLDNVVDFGIRLYIYDSSQQSSPDSPQGLRLIYPSIDDETIDLAEVTHHASTGRKATASGGSGSIDNFALRYPDVVEVYLRVLDRAGAEALVAVEVDGAEGSYADIVKNHGRFYSRTVRVVSRSNL